MMYILEKCPGMRAVRVNQRPTKIVASDYVHAKIREEEPFGPEYARKLGNMSLADGLHDVCEGFLRNSAPQALAVHQDLQANPEREPNILEVELDDDTDHYSATSRKIFAHWFGEGSRFLDSLVSEASQYDMRLRPKHGSGDNHVNPTDEKAQVYQGVKEEMQQGNSLCFMKLKLLDEQLGYSQHLFEADGIMV